MMMIHILWPNHVFQEMNLDQNEFHPILHVCSSPFSGLSFQLFFFSVSISFIISMSRSHPAFLLLFPFSFESFLFIRKASFGENQNVGREEVIPKCSIIPLSGPPSFACLGMRMMLTYDTSLFFWLMNIGFLTISSSHDFSLPLIIFFSLSLFLHQHHISFLIWETL